ncbi:MAG: hypothetical protein WA728_05655, partial [Xanthobacteraceae bacterium]
LAPPRANGVIPVGFRVRSPVHSAVYVNSGTLVGLRLMRIQQNVSIVTPLIPSRQTQRKRGVVTTLAHQP